MQTLTLTDSRPSGSNSARSTTRPIPHNGGNLVAHGYELLRLCCPSRPSLEHLLNGPAERGDSMAGSRLNGPVGLHVHDLGVNDLHREPAQEPPRSCERSPRPPATSPTPSTRRAVRPVGGLRRANDESRCPLPYARCGNFTAQP